MKISNRNLFWPIYGYKLLIWIERQLVNKLWLLQLLKLSLFSFSENKKYSFNIVVLEASPTKFCEEFVACNPSNICVAIKWMRTYKTTAQPETNMREFLDCVLPDDASEIYLIIPITFHYTLGDENQILDKISHLKVKANVHIRLIIMDSTTNNDHPQLLDTESSKIKKLMRISQMTFGTFAIIRICSAVKMCSSGCTTWSLDIKRPGSNQSTVSKSSKQMQIHMLSFSNSSQSIVLPNGKVYVVNNSKDHEPVFMKPTLVASYFRPQWCTNSSNTCQCCLSSNLWSRVSVNEKLVRDLNRRIYESAKEEANSKRCLFNWSTSGSDQMSSLINDQKVLARRSDDGHYYLGSVQAVKSSLPYDQVLVRFGPIKCLTNSSLTKYQPGTLDSDIFDYEWIDLMDIIDLKHAIKHSVEPGDCVLIPQTWPLPKCPIKNKTKPTSLKNLRYYAAVVVSSSEQSFDTLDRSEKNTGENDKVLLVELASCNIRAGFIKVSERQAVWIPYNTYQRIVLEQYMSPESRKWLKNKTFVPNTYPFYSAPGYPADGFSRFNSYTDRHKSNSLIHPLSFQQFKHGMDVQFEYCPSIQCWPLYSVVNDLLPTANGCPVWLDNDKSNRKLTTSEKQDACMNSIQSSEVKHKGDCEPQLVYRSHLRHVR
ncbi:unnamed protein product [Heterobilharzia americana]|nr:unnamed protein product [Heterobilharzia americana]